MPADNRTIFLADCESFYASVEKAANPALAHKPVVVAGDSERRSGLILAACPLAKARGIATAGRLGDALGKCPDLVIVKPRMQLYIDVSLQITKIYETYSDLVEPYSIDEQFIDVTGTLHLFGDARMTAHKIQQHILAVTGVYTRFGISDCKVLAKLACDNYAKKNESGIYVLEREGLGDSLWQLPIGRMFMVGNRMANHFLRMGIHTMGDLARMPLQELKRKLRARFGRNADVQAEVCWRIANGIDDSPVITGKHAGEKSVGHMMTLPREYAARDEIKVIILELCELVGRRCRSIDRLGRTLSLGCYGAGFKRSTGFNRQMTLPYSTYVTNDLYQYALQLFDRYWDGSPVRRVGLSLSGFQEDGQYQLILDDHRERLGALEAATDSLKDKYGDDIIIRAASKSKAGQAVDRASKLGGHYR
ncbi:DNA polymerase IV [Paenibacillus oenotherae]|uniref:DNA polymerase IV n=1 Tax=Paenibacillus oenotherae TaxID=1435645 RepID=A0ABS7DB13_9BACL|nr:DNA polymerase IV [Paenibacillus oenotherae]MBW7477071.1 DNA polymerase IV [Paenibacillus oenotherae]